VPRATSKSLAARAGVSVTGSYLNAVRLFWESAS
jgi:hypothetical protein